MSFSCIPHQYASIFTSDAHIQAKGKYTCMHQCYVLCYILVVSIKETERDKIRFTKKPIKLIFTQNYKIVFSAVHRVNDEMSHSAKVLY